MGTRRSSCCSLAQGRHALGMTCGATDWICTLQGNTKDARAGFEQRRKLQPTGLLTLPPLLHRCSLATCLPPGLPLPTSSLAPWAPAACCATSLPETPRWVGSPRAVCQVGQGCHTGCLLTSPPRVQAVAASGASNGPSSLPFHACWQNVPLPSPTRLCTRRCSASQRSTPSASSSAGWCQPTLR